MRERGRHSAGFRRAVTAAAVAAFVAFSAAFAPLHVALAAGAGGAAADAMGQTGGAASVTANGEAAAAAVGASSDIGTSKGEGAADDGWYDPDAEWTADTLQTQSDEGANANADAASGPSTDVQLFVKESVQKISVTVPTRLYLQLREEPGWVRSDPEVGTASWRLSTSALKMVNRGCAVKVSGWEVSESDYGVSEATYEQCLGDFAPVAGSPDEGAFTGFWAQSGGVADTYYLVAGSGSDYFDIGVSSDDLAAAYDGQWKVGSSSTITFDVEGAIWTPTLELYESGEPSEDAPDAGSKIQRVSWTFKAT